MQTSVSSCEMSKEEKVNTQKSNIFKLNNFCFICCEISCITDLELHVKFVRAYDSKQHKYSGLQTTGTNITNLS